MAILNKQGSILAITTGFIIVFTLFGYEAIFLSGLESQATIKQASSTQAFWLAEAGIEQAFYHLPDACFNTDTDPDPSNFLLLGAGAYSVDTYLKDGFSHRWIIDATGYVPPPKPEPDDFEPAIKTIQAEVGPNMSGAIITTGDVVAPGGGGSDEGLGDHVDGPVLVDQDFTFKDIFGVEESVIKDSHTYYEEILPSKTFITNPLCGDGVIWLVGDVKTTNTWGTHSGILIVDGNLSMEGGHFNGIIWVNGALDKINGVDAVHGSIYIHDPNEGSTIVNGTSGVSYSEEAIDGALDFLGEGITLLLDYRIVRWEEINLEEINLNE